MGLPRIDGDGDTVFARPKILPRAGLGLLFLDEANRVDEDIQSGMLTLLEDRNINGHALGSNWMIILAGNPEGLTGSAKYKVGDFDFALRDRIAKVQVQGDINHLLAFLAKKYENHPLLKALENSPDFVSFDGQGCTPRSFEYAMKASLGISDTKDPKFLQTLSLELGPQAATHLIRPILAGGYVPTLKGLMKRSESLSIFRYPF